MPHDKDAPRIVLAINENANTGEYDGLYLDGKLQQQDQTLYASDVLAVLRTMGISVRVVAVQMPFGVTGYPNHVEDLEVWKPEERMKAP